MNTMPTEQSSPSRRRNRHQRNNTSNASRTRRSRKSSRRNLQHDPRQHELSVKKQSNEAITRNKDQSKSWKRNKGKNAKTTNREPVTNAKLKAQPRKTMKVYRRTKVLRTWVLPTIFLVPLGIIWLEYSIGKLIDLEDIRDVYQEQLVDPWNLLQQDLNASRMLEKSRMGIPPLSPSFLPNISYTPRTLCPPGQRRMINVHNPKSHQIGSGGRLIPMIVHQQSKTRCLTMKVDRATTKWAFQRWSYYIHDEDSRSRLLERYCGGGIPQCEFPLLSQIINKCLYNRTDSRNQLRYYFLKIELWKFLTLWIFGGVYVDLDSMRMQFNASTIDRNDDGFFLIEPDTQMLSTKLMAVSPRHPVMYYAVHHMLLYILMEESSSSLEITADKTEFEDRTRGSFVLSHAFRMFQEGYNAVGKSSNFSPGVFQGIMNRTVRLVASSGPNININTDNNGSEGENDDVKNNFIMSIFRNEREKEAEYKKMGISTYTEGNNATSKSDNRVTLSCLDELYYV